MEEKRITFSGKDFHLESCINFDDYHVFRIKYDEFVAGYFGFFDDGKFNFSIISPTYDFDKKTILGLIKRKVHNVSGKKAYLNPKLYVPS